MCHPTPIHKHTPFPTRRLRPSAIPGTREDTKALGNSAPSVRSQGQRRPLKGCDSRLTQAAAGGTHHMRRGRQGPSYHSGPRKLHVRPHRPRVLSGPIIPRPTHLRSLKSHDPPSVYHIRWSQHEDTLHPWGSQTQFRSRSALPAYRASDEQTYPTPAGIRGPNATRCTALPDSSLLGPPTTLGVPNPDPNSPPPGLPIISIRRFIGSYGARGRFKLGL